MSLPTVVEDLTTGTLKPIGLVVSSSSFTSSGSSQSESVSSPPSSNPHLISGFAPELIIDMELDLIEGKRYLVKYQDANLKMCTWETPRALRNFTELIQQFHQKVKEKQIKLGDGRRRFHKALARVRKREEKRKSQESESNTRSKATFRRKKKQQLPVKTTQSSKESQKKSQETTTFNPLRNRAKVESQESQQTFARRVIDSQSEQEEGKSEEIGRARPEGQSETMRVEDGMERGQEERTEEARRREEQGRMLGRLDSPERISKIWKDGQGRWKVRVNWKQKEEGVRLLPTTYGLERYPCEGYGLLMEYLLGKYARQMRWR